MSVFAPSTTSHGFTFTKPLKIIFLIYHLGWFIFSIMSSRFKTIINIVALFVIIGFAVTVYLMCLFSDAKSTKNEVVYLPKYAPEFLKELAREEYILIEIEPNDPRISSEWIKEHINQQKY